MRRKYVIIVKILGNLFYLFSKFIFKTCGNIHKFNEILWLKKLIELKIKTKNRPRNYHVNPPNGGHLY